MKSTKTTIKGFFKEQEQYTIPVYQRAYSWEEPQWQTFLEDLEEAAKGGNNYFFGNVLLEKANNTKSANIIDGQQRITTIIIFARAVCDVLGKRGENTESIQNLYLSSNEIPKLKSVEYDNEFFQNIIINGEDTQKPQGTSQKRLQEAKKYFVKKLEVLDSSAIRKMLETLEKTELITTLFTNKRDSVLVFELQNDRGKSLTDMEKLKSYLAYVIYTYGENKADIERRLEALDKRFVEMYRDAQNLKRTTYDYKEDDILSDFHTAEYGFKAKNYKEILKGITEPSQKLAWVEQYSKRLREAFADYKDFDRLENVSVQHIFEIDKSKIYPFVIKAYQLYRNDSKSLGQVFEALEIMAFRLMIGSSRADVETNERLGGALANFKDIQSLIDGFKNMCSEEEWYWSDDYIRYERLSVANYKEVNKRAIKYILMRYEEYLCKEQGYVCAIKDRAQEMLGENEEKNKKQIYQIEHIAPQTPNKSRNNGYCTYDKEFKEKYLNCIGNFVLISGKKNIEASNDVFANKLAIYQESPLLQQKEIGDFIDEIQHGKILWDKNVINARCEELENFVFETWSFKD